MYQKGDIVLVPFPFTDLSSTKTRPAVVVSTQEFEKETGSIIVAMVTSIRHNTPFDSELKNWNEAHLLAPSWVRAKLATIEPKLIRFQPGKLTQSDLEEVNRRIYSAFGL